MRPAIRLVLSALLFLLLHHAAEAQLERLPEIVRQKIRITPERLERAMRGEHDAPWPAGSEGGEGGRETVVSSNTASESEVHAAINPLDSNNIILSPIKQPSNPLDGLQCPVYYTKDFGHTWKQSSFKNLPKGHSGPLNVGGGDPMLVFDADGTAYLIWISLFIKDLSFQELYYGLYWAYSTDGGATWQQADAGADAIAFSAFTASSDDSLIYDKEWAAVDVTNSPYRNTLYLAYLEASQSQSTMYIALRKMRPESGKFTQKSVRISDESFLMVQFTDVDVDPSGGVHVTFFGIREDSTVAMWHARSTDGGDSFGPLTKVTGFHFPRFSADARHDSIPGIMPRRLYPCPHLAIDRSNTANRGNLYVTWTADGIGSKLDDGLDIYFTRSTDNGATWSAPFIVNDDERERVRHQFYPSITINGAGVVTVTWYDRRDDERHRNTHYYMAHSFDGGRTFEKSFPVSSKPTDFSSVGERNDGFGIGEYTQVLSTQGHAIAIWSDGRGNAGDLNIYAAFVPIGRTQSGVARGRSVTEEFELFDPAASEGIGFRLQRSSRVSLRLYDPNGRVVATLAEGRFETGEYTMPLDRSTLASGVYYCHIETDFGTATRMITVVR